MRLRACIWLALCVCGIAACPRHTPAPASTTIGAAGGAITSKDGLLKLDIPAGALATAAVVTIAEASNAPPGYAGKAYQLGPEGAAFAVPVQLGFTVDPSQIGKLQVATFAAGSWIPQPTRVGSSNKLIA